MRRLPKAVLGVLLGALLTMAAQSAVAETQPINVNTASVAELTSIQGVGPAKAQAIIDHREKNGPFKTVDDLKLVRGIGDKMLEQLRAQVTVGGTAPAAAPGNGSTAKR